MAGGRADDEEAAVADCLFCGIVAKEIPATVVGETDLTLAFRDINPQAPTHVLVTTKAHHEDVGSLASADAEALAALLRECRRVAEADGIGDAYRVVFNTGAGAGQSVFHVHAHVLGGRGLGWPPG
ncbi:HIT domain-containing protein [Rhizohabitans arisaemae]|uniref:HIT domain-containing protein n=1 Tax=Rhizohabitans arisaemae TaxID=2720610 RepID=UPI0024B18CF1|nr:HIT domain-containing protein [Rhizohabitans arisaemae]